MAKKKKFKPPLDPLDSNMLIELRNKGIPGLTVLLLYSATTPLATLASLIGCGVTGLLLHFAVTRDDKRRLAQHKFLKDQTADYEKLVRQLKDSGHVVVANYTKNGEPQSFIVGCKDEKRYGILIAAGKTKPLYTVIEEADYGKVLFSAGPE